MQYRRGLMGDRAGQRRATPGGGPPRRQEGVFFEVRCVARRRSQDGGGGVCPPHGRGPAMGVPPRPIPGQPRCRLGRLRQRPSRPPFQSVRGPRRLIACSGLAGRAAIPESVTAEAMHLRHPGRVGEGRPQQGPSRSQKGRRPSGEWAMAATDPESGSLRRATIWRRPGLTSLALHPKGSLPALTEEGPAQESTAPRSPTPTRQQRSATTRSA